MLNNKVVEMKFKEDKTEWKLEVHCRKKFVQLLSLIFFYSLRQAYCGISPPSYALDA